MQTLSVLFIAPSLHFPQVTHTVSSQVPQKDYLRTKLSIDKSQPQTLIRKMEKAQINSEMNLDQE